MCSVYNITPCIRICLCVIVIVCVSLCVPINCVVDAAQATAKISNFSNMNASSNKG